MRRGVLQLLSVSVVCWLNCQSAYAGAWNQRAGEGQVISTSSWSHAGEIFDDDSEAVPLRGFTKTESRLYIEHGATDWLTLIGNTSLQTLNFRDGDSRFDFDGFDDIELGLQFRLHSAEGISAAIRASYIIDSRLDNQAVDVLRGGDQYELRALIGQSRQTSVGSVFYDAQLALRSEAFESVSQVQSALTLGYKPTDRWLLLSQNFFNSADSEVVDGFPVPAQEQFMSQISIARQYKPGRYVQLGAGRTLFGRNIVKERSVFIGLWTEY